MVERNEVKCNSYFFYLHIATYLGNFTSHSSVHNATSRKCMPTHINDLPKVQRLTCNTLFVMFFIELIEKYRYYCVVLKDNSYTY